MAEPVLLSGGNPQIPRGDGDAPVQAYIAAMPGWKRDVGRRLDALVTVLVPDVQKSVRYNSPFYAVDGSDWFLGFHCLTKYVKVAFPNGALFDPVPPEPSKSGDTRYVHLREGDDVETDLIEAWVIQAAGRATGRRSGRPG